MANPLYGSNKADAKLDGMVDAQDAIADAAAATAAVGDSDNTEILADVAVLRTKINAIIAALEGAGVIKS
tara:strand:+ start:322 stop:531 length:210 start_codon:yes stop_codon:yes gene_type:complete